MTWTPSLESASTDIVVRDRTALAKYSTKSTTQATYIQRNPTESRNVTCYPLHSLPSANAATSPLRSTQYTTTVNISQRNTESNGHRSEENPSFVCMAGYAIVAFVVLSLWLTAMIYSFIMSLKSTAGDKSAFRAASGIANVGLLVDIVTVSVHFSIFEDCSCIRHEIDKHMRRSMSSWLWNAHFVLSALVLSQAYMATHILGFFKAGELDSSVSGAWTDVSNLIYAALISRAVLCLWFSIMGIWLKPRTEFNDDEN